MKQITLPINREEAIKILRSMPQQESDLNHYLESEAVMKAVAEKLGEDVDYYGMLGLLHDVDWALTKDDLEQHCVKAEEILRKHKFDDEFVKIIQSHGYGHKEIPKFENKKREQKIEFALAASETVTGLVYAYALMRGKKISDMEVSGLKKKFKDKRFAENCNREIIQEIEKTGISIDEFFELAINAIKEIKGEIGLE